MQHFNDAVATYSAMLKAGFERRLKITAVEHARRGAAETLELQRHYCDAFAAWRSCQRPLCRRQHICHGEAKACLRRALDDVAHEAQRRARQAIVAAMPPNLGAPEREARLCMPGELCE